MNEPTDLISLNELERATPLFRGKYGNALCRGLMHLLSIDRVNDLYRRNSIVKGPDFTRAVLEDIGVEYEVLNQEVLANLPDGPFITISNHPYGHLDGVILVDLFGHIRPDFKVMVNKFLGRIRTLDENFICVTPVGEERTAPTKDSIQGIKDAVAHIRSGGALGLFPSGAVSDLNLKDRSIRDREWQEPVIRLIRKMNVPIVPIHFLDRNSNFYYSLGLIDWKVRLLRLVSEVFNKKGKRTRVAIGEIISAEEQDKFTDIRQFGDYLRNKVYNQY
ncbi:MAG: 1-acyl-sn-glycerol-3-phosphate acyltransferase [Bacteroidales bacterium]|nr:1-acyl-sn-glycerol-3-phosphate acyltransferase [Bacteroidales bacterium]